MKATKQPTAQAVSKLSTDLIQKAAANDTNATGFPKKTLVYPSHRVTQLFPRSAVQQVLDLKESISRHGQLETAKVVRGMLIDGRDRVDVCHKLGIEPHYEHLDHLDEQGIFDHCVSLNMHRRHLSESQRAMVGASITQYEVGANQHSKEGVSQGNAAKTMNISVDTLQRAKKVLDQGVPELKAAVATGTLDVTNAEAISTLAPASQAVVLALDPKQILAAAKKINLDRKDASRQKKIANILDLRKKSVPLGRDGTQFELLVADPPWDYMDKLATPYPTMPLHEICGMPVKSRSAANAVLFLWVPASLVREGLEVMDAWDFKFKTTAVWRKGPSGQGGLLRINHELLFIGTRGDVPAVKNPQASCFDGDRGEHSEKPQILFDMIQKMYPELTKLELFCRGTPRPGWAGWGNECIGAIDMPMTAEPVTAANDAEFKDIGAELMAAISVPTTETQIDVPFKRAA